VVSTVGNDLVDLTLSENRDKWKDRRFVRRVFAPSEQDAIAVASDPDRVLWALWSAKEAVYKARGKISSVPFAPQRICASFETRRVIWDGVQYPVAWRFSRNWVHCVTYPEGAVVECWVSALGASIPGELTALEGGAAVVLASRQLRLLAKKRLAQRGYPYADLQIVRRGRRGPPLVLVKGIPADELDLNFAHDGGYIAVALIGRKTVTSRHKPGDANLKPPTISL
jgi:phosphopantetheine--protein transferase-like protein